MGYKVREFDRIGTRVYAGNVWKEWILYIANSNEVFIKIIYMELFDIYCCNIRAAWEDFKFGVEHFNDIERIAMVGEKKWEEGMSILCKPFVKGSVRYFDHTDIAGARDWLSKAQ